MDFVKAFIVSYNFELRQPMRLAVYDMDQQVSSAEGVDLRKQDALGSVDFELSELVRASSIGMTKLLPKDRGQVKLLAEEVVTFKKDIRFTVKGHKLANTDGCALLIYT